MSYFEPPVFRSVILERSQASTRWPQTREGKDEGNESLPEETGRSSILQRWSSSTTAIMENSTCCYEPHLTLIKANERQEQRWVWELEKVSPLPMFYPLQEWNTLKVGNLPLSTITARISECLRLQSIEASYDNNEGSVRCRAFSGVEFVINIWEACDRTTSPATYLIHIQHISGCSMEMQYLQSEIRTSILNPKTTTLSQYTGKQRTNCIRISRELPELDTPGIELTTEGIAHEAPLEFCQSMLDSKLWSEKRLGLESLDALTDRSKTTTDAVQEACFAVLSDSNLQDLLKEHLSVAAPGQENDNSFNNECHDRRGNCILVLKILTRSLIETRNTNNKRRTQSYINNNKFWESTVLNVIFDNIQNASTQPLEASLSARCLLELLDGLYTLPFTAEFTNLQEHILNAIEFGRLHNASLENDTMRLLCHFEDTLAQ